MLVVEVPGLCIVQCGVGGCEQVIMKGRVTKSFESDVLKVLNINLKKKIHCFHCKLT
jgi:hypothetical protein